MPLFRTSVRYKGTRGVCVRIVDVPIQGDCAPILRVIFSHGGEGREPLWDLPWGVEYIGTVSLCSPLISFRFSICRSALRLARRLAVRLVLCRHSSPFSVSFCVPLGVVSPCVSSCVSSLRFAFSACPWEMTFDMGTVPLCSPLVLPCRAVPCRLSRFVFLYSVSPRPSRPASRFVSRLVRLVSSVCPVFRAMPFCVSFCEPICVSSCVPFLLLAV